jgi:hypothetical protein
LMVTSPDAPTDRPNLTPAAPISTAPSTTTRGERPCGRSGRWRNSPGADRRWYSSTSPSCSGGRRGRLRACGPPSCCNLFAWLISHQPAVLSSQNKSATSNQPTVFFSQNKSAPAISHQPNEQAKLPPHRAQCSPAPPPGSWTHGAAECQNAQPPPPRRPADGAVGLSDARNGSLGASSRVRQRRRGRTGSDAVGGRGGIGIRGNGGGWWQGSPYQTDLSNRRPSVSVYRAVRSVYR